MLFGAMTMSTKTEMFWNHPQFESNDEVEDDLDDNVENSLIIEHLTDCDSKIGLTVDAQRLLEIMKAIVTGDDIPALHPSPYTFLFFIFC